MTWRRGWKSRCRVVVTLAAWGISSATVPAQTTDTGPESGGAPQTLAPPAPQPSSPSGEHDAIDPYDAMRAGNELLRAGDASAALRRYDDAAKVLPDAREIAFAQGLAHQRLKQFDEAREAFRRAAAGPGDPLTDDALYSSAASDHAEALQKADDPKAAMSLLESAMDGYQAVLAARPDHEPARDANVKAATRWRQIRELLEQQQQQQDQSSEGDEKKESGEQEQEKSESQESEEPSDEQQQSSPSDDQQQSERQEKQSSDSKDQPQESAQENKQEQSSSEENEQSEESQQEAKEPDSAEEREQVSREQAERKLREMMQGVRDRRKDRRAPVAPVRVAPVDKDW